MKPTRSYSHQAQESCPLSKHSSHRRGRGPSDKVSLVPAGRKKTTLSVDGVSSGRTPSYITTILGRQFVVANYLTGGGLSSYAGPSFSTRAQLLLRGPTLSLRSATLDAPLPAPTHRASVRDSDSSSSPERTNFRGGTPSTPCAGDPLSSHRPTSNTTEAYSPRHILAGPV